jgi:hypothetical protein
MCIDSMVGFGKTVDDAVLRPEGSFAFIME